MENTHDGIVPKELFYKVNDEIMPLKERKDIPFGDKRRKGLCYCPYCGKVTPKV